MQQNNLTKLTILSSGLVLFLIAFAILVYPEISRQETHPPDNTNTPPIPNSELSPSAGYSNAATSVLSNTTVPTYANAGETVFLPDSTVSLIFRDPRLSLTIGYPHTVTSVPLYDEVLGKRWVKNVFELTEGVESCLIHKADQQEIVAICEVNDGFVTVQMAKLLRRLIYIHISASGQVFAITLADRNGAIDFTWTLDDQSWSISSHDSEQR